MSCVFLSQPLPLAMGSTPVPPRHPRPPVALLVSPSNPYTVHSVTGYWCQRRGASEVAY